MGSTFRKSNIIRILIKPMCERLLETVLNYFDSIELMILDHLQIIINSFLIEIYKYIIWLEKHAHKKSNFCQPLLIIPNLILTNTKLEKIIRI